MESSGRKLLPRVQASGAERKEDVGGEALRNGNGIVEEPINTPALWRSPMEDEGAPKRKRQQVEENSPPRGQTLPGVRTLLTVPQPPTVDTERAGPARLIRRNNGAYTQEGQFHFLAPRPAREFPAAIAADPRDLGFALVEPELMNCFRHAYNLRQHVRPKRLTGDPWYDHIYWNDCYGIDTIIRNWTSRYEPGTLRNPAGLLYKQCLWLYFNRSIQNSTSSPAFRQMVDDGLHFLQTFENLLGPSGDRGVLLIPIFILGSTAFYPGQRREIVGALDRLDPSFSIDAVTHAARSLERLWEMMDDGRAGITWDWEKYQAHDSTMATADRSLIELLWDPLMPQAPPIAQAPRVRSPEQYDFDPSRFRAAPPAVPPQPPPHEPIRNQREDVEFYSPPHARSPPRQMSASVENEVMRSEGTQESNPGNHFEHASGPRPFVAPPPPSSSVHSNNELLQVLQRKSTKSKSSVPPCSVCGKELKNPSDAQKHQLQHSKPFRCREPGCTRTQGFATENDLQRHRKSVHGASPRIGNKIGYICSACPDPSDGTSRKWWPRLDNFKAHIRRKHSDQDEESLIQSCVKPQPSSRAVHVADPNHVSSSASARRPEDSYESSYASSSFRTPTQSHLRRQYEGQDTPHGSEYSQVQVEDHDQEHDDDEGQDHEADNSDAENEDRSPEEEEGDGSSLSSPHEQEQGEGEDAMDVSPSAERGDEAAG